MFNTAELLKTKLLKLSSQTVAATFLTRLLADVEDQESDKSSKTPWSVGVRNVESKSEVKANNADALFQRLSDRSEEDATRRLLGGYGIVLDHDPSQNVDRQLLDGAVSDRERKLVQVSCEVESSILSRIERSIRGASDAQHLLMDELLFDTKSNAVKLSDVDIEARMKSLQRSVERAGFSVTNFDMEKLHGINKDREDFVNRWSAT